MLQEEELRILFNEGIAGQAGKKKSQSKLDAEKLGLTESKKEVADLLDAFSSDEDDDDDVEDGVIYVPDEEVAVEIFREKTLEDIIEEQRAKLAAEGKVGTPVTADSFAKWRAGKLLQRQQEAEARVKAEQSKKKGGKGLCELLRSTMTMMCNAVQSRCSFYKLFQNYNTLSYFERNVVAHSPDIAIIGDSGFFIIKRKKR